MEKLTKNSQLNDQTFWTESVSDEELELFWNVCSLNYYFLLELIQMNDLYGRFIMCKFLKAAGNMDEEKKGKRGVNTYCVITRFNSL